MVMQDVDEHGTSKKETPLRSRTELAIMKWDKQHVAKKTGWSGRDDQRKDAGGAINDFMWSIPFQTCRWIIKAYIRMYLHVNIHAHHIYIYIHTHTHTLYIYMTK